MTNEASAGLAGVVAGDTAISTVGKTGIGLTYRGYDIQELTEKSTFEEVAYLLLYSKLPNRAELDQFKHNLHVMRELPDDLKAILEKLPAHANMMDVLRTGCSALGTMEPEGPFRDQYAVATRLLAAIPAMLMYWYHFHTYGKSRETMTDDDGIAEYFLHVLHGQKPDALHRRAMDVSLIIYAEHEFNASTFVARSTTSTRSDIYSAITSAIGTLKGSLHGGANEAAMEVLERFRTPDEAEAGVMELLARKELVMGFGHRVYRLSDPRSDVLKLWAKKLAEQSGNAELYQVAERVEQVMWRERALFPNVDFYSAPLYSYLDIPVPMYTPLFVMARTAGWAAHIFEQREHNKIIRPTARYVGPELRRYEPIEKRERSVA